MRKAFFLDRDGTINEDTGYVLDVKDVHLLPGAAKAVRKINEAGYLAIVISNQSGVARGYGTMEDVTAVNQRIDELLEEYGAHIDAYYICPHHPEGIVKDYAIDCTCRKPGTALFEQAIKDYDIDVSQSVAAGDRKRDVEGLSRLGIVKTGIVGDGEDAEYGSLLEYVKRVCGNEKTC